MTSTERAWQVVEALAAPLSSPESRTFLPGLLLAAVLACLWHTARTGTLRELPRALGLHLWRHRSAWLDVELLVARQLASVLWAGPKLGVAYVLGQGLARLLDRGFGVPALPHVPLLLLSLGYSLVLFVAWDLSRYALHRAMHESAVLWAFHQVHHSATVLTPLTFHRVHPVESLLYDLRGALVGGTLGGLAFWLFRGDAVELTVMGVSAVGLLLNVATGNLRHSHVWIGFGPTLERWLLSPAQHQLHHGMDGREHGCNYGTWLALWDRLSGSLVLAPKQPVGAYGLAQRNHGDDLPSVLVGPVLAALALVCGVARAADDDALKLDPDNEIVVVAPDGTPRVAGSAHVLTEEDLARFAYDDLQQALKKVPGVYVRGEDGFGLRPNIGMRGGNSDRSSKITLLEDGLPLSPAPYAAPAAYYFPLALRLVGVEVFKGPAAIKYGPQTVGGAVNVLTRPVPQRLDAALDSAAGMRDTARLHGWFGVGNDHLGLLLEGAHLSSGGFKVLDTGGPTGFVRRDLLLKLRGQTSDKSETVELKLGYGHESSDETYLGLSLDDFEETPYRRYAASALDHMAWDHTNEALTWRMDLGAFEVRTAAYHAWLGRVWQKFNRFAGGPDVHDLLVGPPGGQGDVYVGILRGEIDTETPDQELEIGTNDRTFHNGGVQTVIRHHVDGEKVGNDLELGVRLHLDDVTRLHTEDPFSMVGGYPRPTGGPTAVVLDSRTTARALATYLYEDLRLGIFHLTPGTRVELIRTRAGTAATGPVDPVDRTAVLPGIGAFASIRPWFDVFGGVHRGFSPVAPESDPTVRAETAWSWEAGTRVHTGALQAEAVGFFSDYDNLVGQCTLSGGCTDAQVDQQFNGGEASVLGLETLLSDRVGLPHHYGLGGTLSYTLTQSAFHTGFVSEFPQFGAVEAGDALPYVPVHQGAATLYADHPRGELSVSATARSDMRDVAGQGEIDRAERIPGMLLFDVASTVHLSKSVSAYATATNVLNTPALESFRPFGARPSAPLQVMVGVKVARAPAVEEVPSVPEGVVPEE